MKRREFIKCLTAGFLGWAVAPGAVVQAIETAYARSESNPDDALRDYLHKIKHFNDPHKNDVQIDSITYGTFESTVMRLRRLQQLVGHGNFQLLSFGSGLQVARKYSEVGEFTRSEIRFLEMIFYEEGQRYGFMGHKPLKKITVRIRNRDVVKIPESGNYLYKGLPFETYTEIKKQIGEHVILTSGIRGVMKQFLLFLNKAYMNNGNLSLASRSLAPPGYSFHGNGDFDVGQTGYGSLNFTERFTTTEVYKSLHGLGYLKLRYPQDNQLGVRFEPWHIKIGAVV